MLHVKVIFVENAPYGLSKSVINNWKSKLFKVSIGSGVFKSWAVPDLDDYAYSDEKLKTYLVEKQDYNKKEPYNLLFFIVDVPLANDCFSRIIGDDTIVVSYYQIKDILEAKGIPLENYLLSSLYTYVFLYKCHDSFSEDNIVHQVSRGCVFDYCGNKEDVINSCDRPKICDDCIKVLVEKHVPVGEILLANKEMKRIRRNLFERLKRKPIIYTLIFSILLPLLVSIAASLIVICL